MARSRGILALVAMLLAALAAAGGTAARVELGVRPAAGGVHVGVAPTAANLLRFDRSSLSGRLAAALAVPHVHRTTEGALAIDLETGDVVYSLNPNRALAPASNEKLTVTYAALARLGPAYRFRTVVLGDGERDGAVWHGNLYLQGHGDPTLRTLGLTRLAAQLKLAGLRRVTGSVLADESAFDTRRTGPGWKPSFYMDESPPLSALVANRAKYHGQTTPDPAGAAAALFTRLLKQRGIAVGGESAWGTAPADAFPLAQIESDPLVDVLRFMDRESDNFTAEMVLKALGAEVAGRGTTGAGAAVVVDALREAGVPLAGVRIADGSGLSRLDRLTPRAIAAILTTAWGDDQLRDAFWRALPVAGRNGTLQDRLDRRPAYGAVHAKTGTTDVASALSGYVRDRFVFAVMQNGHPISTWWARHAQDRFATALAAQ
ncbi:MAG TPA: D-alanyl-D-alanine carboxypeptidase/D-alanyl-D-alanine-endopeptidase [Gaiellaceae bacterium]